VCSKESGMERRRMFMRTPAGARLQATEGLNLRTYRPRGGDAIGVAGRAERRDWE
jgi:hypothetical protein